MDEHLYCIIYLLIMEVSMSKFLIAAALSMFVFSGFSLADEKEAWEKIGESPTESTFIDLDSANIQNNLITLRIRTVFAQPQIFKNEQYRTDQVKLGYECSEKWVTPLSVMKTDGPDGQGKFIQNDTDTSGKKRYPVSVEDPIYKVFIKELCEQYLKR